MKINITETVLRDANQSLIATRMPMSDFEPILETMDKAGYYALECWGGATFDSVSYTHLGHPRRADGAKRSILPALYRQIRIILIPPIQKSCPEKFPDSFFYASSFFTMAFFRHLPRR